MSNLYSVAADKEGFYERDISAVSAQHAAEQWADWYCHQTTEYYPHFTCWVRENGGGYKQYEIECRSTPIFFASPVK